MGVRRALENCASPAVGVTWMNHEVEGAAVEESNGREMTHIARGQPTDTERLGERHD